MHRASFEKIRAFRDAYLPPQGSRVFGLLEVGSMSKEGQASYRALFQPPTYHYLGLDIEPGPNVDLVPADPYSWQEVRTASMDGVISASSFEHNPFFWITAAEIARVVKPGGLVALIAPSSGGVHRHPLDCWRFYPDGWGALCRYVGWDLVESSVEQRRYLTRLGDTGVGLRWHDSFMVGRRPRFDQLRDENLYLERMATIVATRTSLPPVTDDHVGPATSRYDERMDALALGGLRENLRTLLRLGRTAPRLLRERLDRESPKT
jgi:SAM-dependent methyltransferase